MILQNELHEVIEMGKKDEITQIYAPWHVL